MRVEYGDDEPSGLATMVAGLIEGNLERDPTRRRLLRGSVAAIVAPDADVSITIRTSPGRVEIANGVAPQVEVTISADSSRLLELTAAPLRFGLPDAFDRRGRLVLGHVLAGRVRIRGMLRHPRRLARLSALLSAE